jgi:hypothetical protein
MRFSSVRTFPILLSLIFSLLSPNSALAEGKQAPWDTSKLSTLLPGETRAIFGYQQNDYKEANYSYSMDGAIYGSNKYWSFTSVLMPCSYFQAIDKNFTACIEKVSSRKIGTAIWSDGTLGSSQLGESSAILKRGYVLGKIVYDGTERPDGVRTDGDRATIWNMTDAKHQGGTSYLVRANYSGTDGNGNRLDLKILPVSISSNEKVISESAFTNEEFPTDVEFKVKLRLGVFIKTLTGWFFGRLVSPVIDRNGPEGYLEVSGFPAKVPVGITQPLVASEVKNYLDPAWCTDLGYTWGTNCGPSYGIIGESYTAGQAPPGLLEQLEKVPGGVTTISTLSYWNIGTSNFITSYFNPGEPQKCVSELYGANARVFQGAVLSNASLFQTSSPTWNETNQSFTFKVASPHLDENSKPNIGFYTLYLPVEIAKCRWGSAATNAKAEVQIVDSSGVKTITTVAATVLNGILRFNISGFGYSSPTIGIRMSSENMPVKVEAVVDSPAPSATPTSKIAIASRKKMITITCVKGKLSKKVMATKPVCPTGYKKK